MIIFLGEEGLLKKKKKLTYIAQSTIGLQTDTSLSFTPRHFATRTPSSSPHSKSACNPPLLRPTTPLTHLFSPPRPTPSFTHPHPTPQSPSPLLLHPPGSPQPRRGRDADGHEETGGGGARGEELPVRQDQGREEDAGAGGHTPEEGRGTTQHQVLGTQR